MLDADRLNAGDMGRVFGTVTVFADAAVKPRNQGLQLQMTLLGDGGGRQ